jgi:hypothetical protein
MKHPIQPLEEGCDKVIRFKKNAIVKYLLEHAEKHGCNLNDLRDMGFSKEDHQQLAQLIGYSLGGYGDLSFVDAESYHAAVQMYETGTNENTARINYLQTELNAARTALREPIARLFGIDPSTLGELA